MDTSALLAILFRENDAERFDRLITGCSCRMSVANVLEATMVVEGRGGRAAGNVLDEFLVEAEIEVVDVTNSQMQAARDAWRRFGKGNHPPD